MNYQLLEHISLTEVDDEMVLLNLLNGSYYGLNHIGAQFLRAIELNISSEEAIQQIADDYAQSYDNVSRDIQQLIDQLLSQKLLTQSNTDKSGSFSPRPRREP